MLKTKLLLRYLSIGILLVVFVVVLGTTILNGRTVQAQYLNQQEESATYMHQPEKQIRMLDAILLPFYMGSLYGTKETAEAIQAVFHRAGISWGAGSLKVKREMPIEIDINKFEDITALRQTCDGGYIILGSTDPYKGNWGDICLIKTDSNGKLLWQKTYGREDRVEKGYSVVQTEDGGYLVAGWAGLSLYVVKFNANGEPEWERTFADGLGSYVEKTSDGQYIITGWINDDICAIQIDENGNSRWERLLGLNTMFGAYSFGRYIQQTSDGGYIVLGEIIGGPAGKALCLLKLDSAGYCNWIEFFEEIDDDNKEVMADFVKETEDNGYIIAGTLCETSPDQENPLSSDIVLIRIDANRNIVWRKIIDKGKYDNFCLLEPVETGNYMLLFCSSSGEEECKENFNLLEITDDGKVFNDKTVANLIDGDYAMHVQRTSQNNIIALMINKDYKSAQLVEFEMKWPFVVRAAIFLSAVKISFEKAKDVILSWISTTFDNLFNKSTPEKVVIKYLRAIEKIDVDKICELTASESLFNEMARFGINSLDEYKEIYRVQLLNIASKIKEKYGENWSKNIVTEVVAQTDTRARVRVRNRIDKSSGETYIDLVKENGRWKVLAE